MSKWYEFKKLYSASEPNNCIFKAYVYDKDTYRIIINENNIFGNIFLRIINGNFVMHNLVESQNNTNEINNKFNMPKYEDYKIDNNDAIKNLEVYIKELPNEKLRNCFILKEVNIIPTISFRFKGPDFNYEQGMNPTAYNRATKLVNDFSSLISNDNLEDQFLTSQAGSLIFDIKMPENINSSNINDIKQALVSINDESENDINSHINDKLIKYLYELSKIQHSNTLEIYFPESDVININFNNIIEKYKRLGKRSINIKEIPDNYSNRHNSFKIKKYVCKMNDPEKKDIERIKNAIENSKKINVQGFINVRNENTILVEKIVIDDDIITFKKE